jgi:aryl-alcohol dehydrogenase
MPDTPASGYGRMPRMTTITAAVSRGTEAPFTLETLELDAPRPDELLVKIQAAGLCHTDVSTLEGPMPRPWPGVLGHEGVGVVEAVGSSVTDFAPGDHVVISFAWCGQCAACLKGRPTRCARMVPLNFAGTREDGSTTMTAEDGSPVYGSFFGQSSFATHALTPARDAVKVPDDIDASVLAALGCTTFTGAGSIVNALRVEPGERGIVSGVGAVGLAAVMAAAASGATRIVAVDVHPARLQLARELGATHTIDGRDADVFPQIQQALGGPADFAVDTSGVPSAVQAVIMGLNIDGRVALIAGGLSESIPPPAMFGKTVHHVIAGDVVPRVFLPHLIDLHRQGRFPVERLITTYPLADIAQAVADTKDGTATKAVILMP